MSTKGTTSFTWADLRMLLRLVALAVVAWLLPETAWRPLREKFMGWRRRAGTELQDTVEGLLQRRLRPVERRELMYRSVARDYEDTLRVLRCYRPGGWTPEIVLEGESHVQRALEHGKGVVLWVSHCSGSRLATKVALARAGLAVHHLSRPSHGFSATPFGIRYLNQYWQRIENRYLAERIVISDNTIRVMKRLKTLLNNNQIVSITDHAKARQHTEVAFLNGSRSVATGPANLAHSSGATLLSVLCRERGPGQFTVIVAPPLPIALEPTRRVLTQHYCELLADFVASYPHLWLGWWWDTDLRVPGLPPRPALARKQKGVAG